MVAAVAVVVMGADAAAGVVIKCPTLREWLNHFDKPSSRTPTIRNDSPDGRAIAAASLKIDHLFLPSWQGQVQTKPSGKEEGDEP
jgi:hypothetical protein